MPTASRRTALAVSGLTLGLCATGCGPATTSPAAVSESADTPLLLDARADLAGTAALVRAVRRAHPALRPRLAGLQQAHRTQLQVLDPDGGARGTVAPEVPAQAPEALRSVVRAEERLVRRLVTWAVAADSGPLARALAASAAGVSQELASLGEDAR